MTIDQAINLHYPDLFLKIIENNIISFETINEIDIIQQKNEAELEIMSIIEKKLMKKNDINCSQSEH